jgi:hypothetical protein
MTTTQHRPPFSPGFLATLSALELAALQHDLRAMPEDARYLAQVLEEFKRRARARAPSDALL